MFAHTGAIGGGRLVETDGVGAVLVLGITDGRPQLHADLGGHGNEPRREVGDLRVRQRLAEGGGVLHLLDHGSMVVDAPLLDLVEGAVVKQVFDADLILVLLDEIAQGDGSLEPDEAGGEVEQQIAVPVFCEEGERLDGASEPDPRAPRRVDLVRLVVVGMLKVLAVAVDEIPQDTIDLARSPAQPVFYGRLDIEDGPPVKLGRVHLAHLVLAAVLTAVDGSDDQGLRVQVPPVDLAAVSQLEETLTDLHRSPVNLIEKEDHGLGAGCHKPVGSVPRRSLATIGKVGGVGQTEQIAFGHLGCTTLDNGKPALLGDHVDDLGLADAVATTDKDRQSRIKDGGDGGKEGCEIESHVKTPVWLRATFGGQSPPVLL